MRHKLLAVTASVLIAAGCTQGQCGAAKPVPSPSATSQTVLELQGAGSKSTSTFTVPAKWAVAWTYDCRSGLAQNGAIPSGSRCTFTLTVKAPDGSASAQNLPLTHQDVVGQGVAIYDAGGTFYLTIDICCAANTWSLKVLALTGS